MYEYYLLEGAIGKEYLHVVANRTYESKKWFAALLEFRRWCKQYDAVRLTLHTLNANGTKECKDVRIYFRKAKK